MFLAIARFELLYQLRQPAFLAAGLFFFLLAFGAIASGAVDIGAGGNVYRNAAFTVVQIHILWALFFMLFTAAFVANVVLRDDETRYAPIIHATPVTRFDYLLGRFTGAYGAALLAFLSVPAGLAAGTLAPWVDPLTVGPLRADHLAFSYFVMAAPDILLTGALFFTLATLTRSMMATYVGVTAFLVSYLLVGALLQSTALVERPQLEQIAGIFEPLGLAAHGLVARYWTAVERNTLLPALEGVLLYNRLFVLALSGGLLLAAYILFRFKTRAVCADKNESGRDAEHTPLPSAYSVTISPRLDRAAMLTQLFARTRLELRHVLGSVAFTAILLLGLANAIGSLLLADEMFGVPIYPVTRVMIGALENAFSIVPVVVAIYYAGELLWREREQRVHEIIDATPVSDWAMLLPKTLAIVLVLLATLLISVAGAMAVQTLASYTDFELDKYLLWYALPRTLDWSLLAVLAVFLQVVAPNKFIGWGLMVVHLIGRLVLADLGFEHHLYNYGSSPEVPLSDMNGQGQFWIGAAWLRAYWSAVAVLLLVLSYGLWKRGTPTRLTTRLRHLPRRVQGASVSALAVGFVFAAICGTYTYFNTNVWNDYRTARDNERLQARYEQELLRHERLPQPKITHVTLSVDLRPGERSARASGAYRLENRTGKPVSEVHIRFDPDLTVEALRLEGATQSADFSPLPYRILTLTTPMQPGEQRTLEFETRYGQHGFRNSGNLTRIVGNGTFLDNGQLTPYLGMSRDGLLADRATRRKYGLPPELPRPKLGDERVRELNAFRHDSDWVTADITVSTDADQTPIAPGYKVSDTERDGRRTARFVAHTPIQHFFSIQSARYAVRRESHRDIELAIYYDARHAWNVERMLTAMRTALDYGEEHFSPYQFRQARILEFPAYGRFAQAFANTVPYSEGIGFISRFAGAGEVDHVTYVTAHEIAHQWWGHQMNAADVEGASVLSETLAQYTALMVMEQMYGPAQIRRFLKFELDDYLRSRGSDAREEAPLYRTEGQPYVHYRKGSLAMYRLKDEIGAEAINRALRSLLSRFAFKGPPYPTTLDLLSALRAEAGPERVALITDLFERITLYDVRVTRTQVARRADGRFDVNLALEAQKYYSDGTGRESVTALAEQLDIGLFAAEPGSANFSDAAVIAFERRLIRTGPQTLTFTVDREPRFAGVDPYNKLIDRRPDDNVARVALKTPPST